jgi:hypothetical protein
VRLSHHVALCLLLTLPCAARADDIGPDQAKALQQQLKSWLTSLLGPTVKLPDMPWQVTGEHDHYKIAWPIPGLDNPAGPVAVTASVRPLDGGRWSIDDVQAPPAASFTVTVPETPGDLAKGGPMKVAYTIGKQDIHATIDPNLATPSTLHADVGAVAITTDNATQHQEQHVDRYLADATLKPAQNGRVDVAMSGAMEGWRSAATVNGGEAMAIAAKSIRAKGEIDGVSRDRVAALLAAAGATLGALPPDVIQKGSKAELPASAKAQARLAIAALQDMMTAVNLEETIDGLQVEVAGMGSVAMQHILIGFGGDAPAGKLHVWFDIGLDGLKTAVLPPKIAAYLPQHIEVRPSLSGVRTADLAKLATDATEDDSDDRVTADIAALFAHGGAVLGIEALSFDLGPAKLEGTGQITMLTPTTWHGEAHLSATGLDELTTQARTNPDLQQAIPILIMLRGLAKPDGDHLVWNVVSDGPSLTVNGLDLSQLGGGGDKPKGKSPGGQPGQPSKR